MSLVIAGWTGFACFTAVVGALLFWPQLRRGNALRAQAVVIVAALLLLSGALYMVLGSPAQMLEYTQIEERQAAAVAVLAQKEKATAEHPESVAAWHELGEAYLQAGRPGIAVLTLRRAVQLSNGEPMILLDFGKAQVLAAGGEVKDDAAETFRMVLLQMDDAQAKLFLAMHAAAKGDVEQARELLTVLMNDENTPDAVRAAAREQWAEVVRK